MIEILDEMQWYMIQFLGDLAWWLITCPIALIFVCLFLLVFVFYVARRIMS